jgi:hypothetical protein
VSAFMSSFVLPSVFSFLTLASWASSHFFFPCHPYLYLHPQSLLRD